MRREFSTIFLRGEREGGGVRRALRNFDEYLLVRSPQKADPFPR